MAQLMTCSIFSLTGTAEDPQTEQPLLKQPPSLQDSKETEEIETSKKRQSFVDFGFLRATFTNS